MLLFLHTVHCLDLEYSSTVSTCTRVYYRYQTEKAIKSRIQQSRLGSPNNVSHHIASFVRLKM